MLFQRLAAASRYLQGQVPKSSADHRRSLVRERPLVLGTFGLKSLPQSGKKPGPTSGIVVVSFHER